MKNMTEGVLWDSVSGNLVSEEQPMERYLTFFTADYRDGIVYINGRKYSAGTFAVKMMNRFREDACARISVFRMANWNVQEQLKTGFVLEREYVKAGWEIEQIIKILGKVEPFNLMNLDTELERIKRVFTEENARKIEDHFRQRSLISEADHMAKEYGTYQGLINMEKYHEDADFITEVNATLRFYDTIGEGMGAAYHALREFVLKTGEAARFDEAHLLPIAQEFINGKVEAEICYVPVRKNRKIAVARRMQFADFYSFLMTDFYEGLHYGHYPRQCPICRRYFLMESARKQKYCNGIAPQRARSGKKITCRRYATSIKRKERAEDDPVSAAYTTRMNYIRKNESRGIFDHDYALAAKDYALACKQKANMDDEYLAGRYYHDMSCANFIKSVDSFISSREAVY